MTISRRQVPPADLADVLELRRRGLDVAMQKAAAQREELYRRERACRPEDNEHDPWGVW